MDCPTSHITLKKQFDAMFRKVGVLIGLPIVAVGEGTHTENALRCDNNHLTLEDLFKSSIGVDSCGKPALRVKFIDTCDTLAACKTSHDEDQLRKMFAYDSDAKTYALVINQST